ncbi:MAG: DUF3761 domain-containing protein [Kofleriaceae bacterium]
MRTCEDATTTTATGRGACSHHGGQRAEHVTRAAPHTERIERTEPRESTTIAPRTERIEPRESTTIGHESGASGGSATARCRDGSLSYSQHHAGSCSRHGGVAAWVDR